MTRIYALLVLLISIRIILFYINMPQKSEVRYPQISEKSVFTSIKNHVGETYRRYLNPKDAGLLMGIVLGAKDLDKGSMKNFQKTGVTHIIAASGMNVSMLTSFVLAGLLIFLSRKPAIVLTGLIILFYTALADFQASIVRAAIMGIIALGAGLFGRQNTSILALLITAYLMIFWDPAIITSISFILSFSATLGIITIDPLFKRYISKSDSLEDFRTTTSAQISTTPILLFFFGTYSFISILTNLLVLWTIPPLMILGGVGALLSFIPQLSAPFVLLCMPLLAYFWIVIDFFSKYAFQVEVKNIPWTLIVGYYLILGAVVILLYKGKKTHA